MHVLYQSKAIPGLQYTQIIIIKNELFQKPDVAESQQASEITVSNSQWNNYNQLWTIKVYFLPKKKQICSFIFFPPFLHSNKKYFLLLFLVNSAKFTITPIVPDNNRTSQEVLVEPLLSFCVVPLLENWQHMAHNMKQAKKKVMKKCKGCSSTCYCNKCSFFEMLPQMAASHFSLCSFYFHGTDQLQMNEDE